LIAEDVGTNSRLLANDRPDLHWQDPVRMTDLHFVFTKYLPEDWFPGSAQKEKLETEAREWVERVGASLDANGKRAAKSDYIAVLREKFDLREHGAEQVWKTADIPNRGMFGNIPNSERASIADIERIK